MFCLLRLVEDAAASLTQVRSTLDMAALCTCDSCSSLTLSRRSPICCARPRQSPPSSASSLAIGTSLPTSRTSALSSLSRSALSWDSCKPELHR